MCFACACTRSYRPTAAPRPPRRGSFLLQYRQYCTTSRGVRSGERDGGRAVSRHSLTCIGWFLLSVSRLFDRVSVSVDRTVVSVCVTGLRFYQYCTRTAA